jgi:acetyl-CoA carboxylase carboxyltransferase component
MPQVSIIHGKCAAGSVYGAINTDMLIGTKDSISWITTERGYIDAVIEPAHTRL